MTLLLREVVALVTGAAIWLGAAVALAILGAVVAAAAARRGPRPRELRLAVIVALVVAGLAGRFSAPDPLEFGLMHRPLPVSWLLAGAIAGAALARILRSPSPTVAELRPPGRVSPPPGA